MDFFGFIPNKESNTWGITILPTFLFSSGSNFRMCIASLASHFESITDVIYKSKEKLFKKVKQHQVRKFKHLQESPTHRNTPVPEHISKKCVINLASKDLSPGEVKLLQRGPKFAVSTLKVPVTEYIAVTKQICGDRLGENTDGVDCSEYYQKTKDLLPRLQGQVCIPSKHLQNGKGGHQNPQGRQHTCSPYCRQGGSHGSHG